MSFEPREGVQAALDGFLDEGEVVVRWVTVIEVADKDGVSLMHRAGGGDDGTEAPTSWQALGMLQTSVALAEEQSKKWSVGA